MTSRDLTENVEQLQIVSALRSSATGSWPRWSSSAQLAGRVRRPADRRALRTTLPAQVTTLGQAFRHGGRTSC